MGMNWNGNRNREITHLIKQQARDDAAYTHDLTPRRWRMVTIQCPHCAHIGKARMRVGAAWRFRCTECKTPI